MLLVTDQQVYEELHEMLMTDIKTPVQLVFRDSLCLDCGAQGDERLLDNYCHMDFQLIHPKNSILFHPEEKVPHFLILVLLKIWAYFFSHRNITIPQTQKCTILVCFDLKGDRTKVVRQRGILQPQPHRPCFSWIPPLEYSLQQQHWDRTFCVITCLRQSKNAGLVVED